MDNENVTQNRPVFLTIICIISFVGLGFVMMKSLFIFALGQLASSMLSFVQNGLNESLGQVQISEPNAAPLVENIFNSVLKLLSVLPTLAGLTFVLSGIALSGVILMWNLRKSGFYMFCAAKVILIFLPVGLIGVNFLSLLIGSFTFMIAAVFITLYALNVKAMN